MIGIEVGQLVNGDPVRVPLEVWSTLLGGLPGSGKSSTLRCVVAGASMRDDVAIVCIDPKRVELPLWRPRAAVVATELSDVTSVLSSLVALVDDRFARMETDEVTYWPRTPDTPAVVVVVDELAEVVDSGEGGDSDRERLLRRLLSKGRAAGVIVIAATQRPSHDVFSLRVAHACATREASAMILGLPDGGLAETLPLGAGYEGLCYVLGEGERTPVLGRVDWLEPGRARALATETARFKPPLDLPVSLAGAPVLPARSWPSPGDNTERVLAALAAGQQTAPAVARATNLAESTVRRVLDQLAREGHVRRLNGSQWQPA